LVHISELSHDHVVDPTTVVKVGDKVQVKIIDLGADSHRLGLSLKATQTPRVQTATEAAPAEEAKTEMTEEASELDELGLTKAVIVKLNAAGIHTKADLEGKTLEDLTALPGIGETSAQKIVAAMTK